MGIIFAKGIYLGQDCTIKCYLLNGSPVIELDGEFNQDAQNDFEEKLKHAPSIGGTYHPDSNSLLAAYSVLDDTFFDIDSNVQMDVIGDIGTIPIAEDIEDIVY